MGSNHGCLFFISIAHLPTANSNRPGSQANYSKVLPPPCETLLQHPDAKITVNINGTLTEQLADYGFTDVIEDLEALGNRGQIEFTGSAKFHPLLPLLPEPEVIRQIKLNQTTNRQFFGKSYKPRGFFPQKWLSQKNFFPSLPKRDSSGLSCPASQIPSAEIPTTFIYAMPRQESAWSSAMI